MPFVILPTNSASGGYNITNSLRFNSGSSDYLARTPSSTTNQQIFTFSTWFKFSDVSATYNNIASFGASSVTNGVCYIDVNSSKQLEIFMRASGTEYKSITSQLFRDVSAWYHIVIAVDTTQATSTNRTKVYVNGSQVSAFSTQNAVPQNTNLLVNTSGSENRIGASRDSGSSLGSYFNGYQTEIYLIDGQQLTPTSFGETDEDTGIWKPKAYTGTYGTNGFYLQFKNSASLGTDSSGNGNTFTVNNLTSIDQTTDTPTNNYCTINPLDNYYASNTITEGNLKISTSVSAYSYITSTMAVSKGKWYCEYKINTASATDHINGIASKLATSSTQSVGTQSGSTGYKGNGQKAVDGTSSSYGNSLSAGDIVGIALDLDNNFVYFSKNGTFQNSGVPTSGSSGTGGIAITAPASTQDGVYYFAFGDNANLGGGSYIFDLNFGNPIYSANSYTDGAGFGNFSYQVPSGFYSLNTKNLSLYG